MGTIPWQERVTPCLPLVQVWKKESKSHVGAQIFGDMNCGKKKGEPEGSMLGPKKTMYMH